MAFVQFLAAVIEITACPIKAGGYACREEQRAFQSFVD